MLKLVRRKIVSLTPSTLPELLWKRGLYQEGAWHCSGDTSHDMNCIAGKFCIEHASSKN